jgi:hypothetical protein
LPRCVSASDNIEGRGRHVREGSLQPGLDVETAHDPYEILRRHGATLLASRDGPDRYSRSFAEFGAGQILVQSLDPNP